MCTDSCWLLCIFSLCRQATPSQVYFTGDVKGETAIKTESDIGSAITHHFRVSTGKATRSFIYFPEFIVNPTILCSERGE